MNPLVVVTSPTAVLQAEHRVIERVLDILESIARDALDHNRIHEADTRETVEILRVFADGCHHLKEETILFPALEKAMPGFGAALVMSHEHEEGRARLRSLMLALDQRDSAAFANHAFTYIANLRAHIMKEDHCLWPMADRVLDAATQRRVLADFRDAFRRAEETGVGPGVHERMLEMTASLCERRGLPPLAHSDDVAPTFNGGCCGH